MNNHFRDNGTAPHRIRQMPFASAYEGVAAGMVGSLVYSYSRDQRESKEWHIRRAHGFRPVARINFVGRK